MQKQKLERWQEIEKISQEMRDLAVANQSLANSSVGQVLVEQPWQEISSLDLKRIELLKQFFSIPANENESEFLTQRIKRVLEMDLEVITISLSLKKGISKTFAKIGCQQRAAVAYGCVQTS